MNKTALLLAFVAASAFGQITSYPSTGTVPTGTVVAPGGSLSANQVLCATGSTTNVTGCPPTINPATGDIAVSAGSGITGNVGVPGMVTGGGGVQGGPSASPYFLTAWNYLGTPGTYNSYWKYVNDITGNFNVWVPGPSTGATDLYLLGSSTAITTNYLLKGDGTQNGAMVAVPGTDYVIPSGSITGNAAGLAGTPGCSTSGQGYVNSAGAWTCATLATSSPATASTAGIVKAGTGLDVQTDGTLSTNVTTAGDIGMKCDGSTNDTSHLAAATNVTLLLPQNSVCMVSNQTFGNNVIIRGNATLRKIASDTVNPLINQYNGSNIQLDGVTLDLNGGVWGSYPNNNTSTTALTCSGGSGYPPYTTVAMSFSGGGGSNLGGLMFTSGTGTCGSVTLTIPGHGYTSNPTASAACPVGWSGCTAPTFSWGTTTPQTAANTLSSQQSAQVVFQYVDNLNLNNVSITNTNASAANGSLYANALEFTGASGVVTNLSIDPTVGGLDAYVDPYQNGATRSLRIVGGHLDGSQLGGIKVQTGTLITKTKIEIGGVTIGCRSGAWTYSTTFTGALSAGATTGTVSSLGPLAVGYPLIFPSHGSDTTETAGFQITAISGNTITFTPAVTNAHATGQGVVYPFQTYGVFDATGGNGPYGNGIDTYLVGGVNMHDNRVCEPRFSGLRIAGVGSVNNIADHNTVEYAGETGIYCAELGAAASNCRGNVLFGTNISDTNPSSRVGQPYDQPNLIEANFLYDCGYACIHAEHATVRGNHMFDYALGLDLGNGGTGYNIEATDNVAVNDGIGGVTSGVGVAISDGLTQAANSGIFLRNNAVYNNPLARLTIASINSYGPNITGISQANPAVITFGAAPNPVINVGEVWVIRGQYMVQVTPNATSGKYPSINGSMCGVTATTTTSPYTATCGGVTGVPALNTTTYTPWIAPLAGNNPGLFTRVLTTSLVPGTWPSRVEMVRDNAPGSGNNPSITAGAALGTGPTISIATAANDSFTQFTTTIGTSPTTGTVATGIFYLPTSRFSSNMCDLVNPATGLSITNTQATWTVSTSVTATSQTITVRCKLD